MNLSTVNLIKERFSKRKDLIVQVNDEQLVELHHEMLTIMDDIIEVCEKNNLRYALSGGTLLGAIRHKGFIPWDDDSDLEMPREDYVKFVKLFQEAYGWKYWLHIPGQTKHYGLTLMRVRKKGTVYKTHEDYANDECGVFVDIFVVENTYNNQWGKRFQNAICLIGSAVTSCRNFFDNRKFLMSLAKGDPEAEKIFKIKIFLGAFVAWLPVHVCARFADKQYSICHNNNSEMISIPSGRKKFYGELFSRAEYCSYVKVPFEGRNWNAPVGYEQILKRLYGDYMQLPTEEQREHHVLLAFDLNKKEDANDNEKAI